MGGFDLRLALVLNPHTYGRMHWSGDRAVRDAKFTQRCLPTTNIGNIGARRPVRSCCPVPPGAVVTVVGVLAGAMLTADRPRP